MRFWLEVRTPVLSFSIPSAWKIWNNICDRRSFGLWCIKGTDECKLAKHWPVPLILHGPSDLRLKVIIGIFPMEHTRSIYKAWDTWHMPAGNHCTCTDQKKYAVQSSLIKVRSTRWKARGDGKGQVWGSVSLFSACTPTSHTGRAMCEDDWGRVSSKFTRANFDCREWH